MESEVKAAKALKSLQANRKYRQNIKDKLNAVQTDTRLDDILDILRLIQKRLDDMDSSNSDEDSSNSDADNSDTDSEPSVMKQVKQVEVKPVERKYLHQYSSYV